MKRNIVVIAVLLMNFSSFGQKSVDLNDCRTLNRIMNDSAVDFFLYSTIDREKELIFENAPVNSSGSLLLNIDCKFDIGGSNYRIFDSAEVVARRYVPNQIVKISVFKSKSESIRFVLEWMEIAAQFNVSRSSEDYTIRLDSIDHLD